ncbi:MAG: plasmid recombination protein [Acidobacteria bacterium]|nr:plasmid recombination protein [Acidobacteriota bacterium]
MNFSNSFSEKTVEFLREKYGDRCVKAILHMDEHTPHIHAFMVPIDGRGRLNCKSFFGTREKFRQFQTEYARKVETIGLERGVEYSRARHTDVQRFYATIMEPVHIKVNHEHIPDPPQFMTTVKSREEYKRTVVEAVSQHLGPQFEIMRNQALLAVGEKRKRQVAEKLADARIQEAEERAEELVQGAERAAGAAVAQLVAEREENQLLRQENGTLRAAFAVEEQRSHELDERVRVTSALVRDIHPGEVMTRLAGHRGERRGEMTVYRAGDGNSEVVIFRDKAYDRENKVIAGNALELVMRVATKTQGGEVTQQDALAFLAEEFGKDRAVAAMAAFTRDVATRFIDERGLHTLGKNEERVPERAPAPTHEHEEALMH